MKKNTFLLLAILIFVIGTFHKASAQLSMGSGVTLYYEGHGGYGESALSVSSDNGYTNSIPFLFANSSSSAHTFYSAQKITSFRMSGTYVHWGTNPLQTSPIMFNAILSDVDNANGAYVTFYSTTSQYSYIKIRNLSSGVYSYKVNLD